MTWSFGIRKKKSFWVITEEFQKYGYCAVGMIDGVYKKKEIIMMCKDILRRLDV